MLRNLHQIYIESDIFLFFYFLLLFLFFIFCFLLASDMYGGLVGYRCSSLKDKDTGIKLKQWSQLINCPNLCLQVVLILKLILMRAYSAEEEYTALSQNSCNSECNNGKSKTADFWGAQLYN